ncbi:cytochrome p450 [Colletotrichum karsti]|uniref:Cytochrome p450 n=1 Tax=Colletotrichum karsti TaxID=1095194 RepID=A0A9P6IAZ4_9PEZI|nr:cytochrome p450 [Colletotrichum karsti]KAF9879230.1 cytochrome p450 [Colletotrichum karsti]
MIPLDLLPGLGSTKSLSFAAFLEEEFSMKRYTKVGNLDEKQIVILNKKLNPSLNEYVPVFVNLIRHHWPLDDYDVLTQPKMTIGWILPVNMFTPRSYGQRTLKGGLRYFVPGSIDSFKRKERKGGHLSNPPSLLDYLADGELGGDDVEAHTVAQINLCVAAIQSMASTVTQCLMDLATYPQYLPELREEITSMLSQKNGVLDRQSLADMMKLDSFIKETQRLNPPDLASFQRKVMSDITLANGLRIPKGARIALPTGAINMDSQFFEDPETFDGFRYYRLRMESEEARKSSQMVTVGKKDLTWGYGRHACPGRYIAEVAMKLLIIEYIVRYDISLPDGIKERPKNIEFEGLVIPDPNWELVFQSR